MTKTGYPSIDRTHLRGISEERLNPEILPLSMFTTFMRINGDHLDEIALEIDGTIYSKQTLRDDIIKFAGLLLKEGITANDKIVIIAPNTYEGIIATFGANAIGIKVVMEKPLNETNIEQFYEELDIHRPKMVLFYDKDATCMSAIQTRSDYIKLCLTAKSTDSYTERYFGFKNVIDSIDNSVEQVLFEIEKYSISVEDEPMLYLKTSGSTSTPKTLPFSNRAIFASLIYAANSTGTDTRDESVKKVLCQASYYHGYGWMPLFVNIMGGNQVILAGATPEDVANYYKFRPSYIYGSPLTLRQFIELTPKDADITTLVAFFCAGAVLHENDYKEGIKFFRERGCTAEIRNNYGISEGLCIGTFNDHIEHIPNTAGRFYIGPEWLIVDEDGKEVKYGEIGEVIVSAASLCQGYFGDEDLTKEKFVKREGKTFFKTGDFLSLNENGYVSFVGREKRFFMAVGVFEKVNCEIIENAISSLESVYQNAVIVTPEETGAKAFVTLRHGFSITEKDIEDALSKVLNSYEMPREIVIIDKIPMMESGKVNYKLLEKM